jgi:hypothetical protein
MASNKIKSGKYQIVISPEIAIDLGDIPAQEWVEIKLRAKQLILSGETADVILAYIASFAIYIQDLQLLGEPYDPDQHKFH